MALDHLMRQLVDAFRPTLEQRAEQLKSFHRYGVQVEGWLKGETLHFLERQKRSGAILDFDREVLIPLRDRRKRVDFRIDFRLKDVLATALVELKHWTSEQKGVSYKPEFYFGDRSSVGIYPDVVALNSLSSHPCYLLILMTANPGKRGWNLGVEKFNSRFTPLCMKALNEPHDYPDSYFLGLLRVLPQQRS